ncbi:MAG: hypothetical protein JXR94_19000, partial [Candidatus Hydrogenedentes bacterium]|nr:hypothetical protein [Candidatus Hydrogenedentota bacterium]
RSTGLRPDGVTLLLDGDLSKDDPSATVTIANNSARHAIQGQVLLTGPQGWNIAPIQFDYQLGPGEFEERRIVVLRQGEPSGAAGIVAQTTQDGQTYMDTLIMSALAVGTPAITVAAERSGNEVVALVKNGAPIPAQGYLDLIAPPACWPELAPNPAPAVYPRRASVAVAPFSEQRIVFRVIGNAPAPWLVAKLAANGNLLYARVAG